MLPAVGLITACEIFGPQECPASVEPAIVVHISDAATGEWLAAGASGFVRDGAYTDSLAAHGFEAGNVMTSRSAAGARPGVYEVHVEHPGYEPWTRADVSSRSGDCGVVSRHIDVELTPAAGS